MVGGSLRVSLHGYGGKNKTLMAELLIELGIDESGLAIIEKIKVSASLPYAYLSRRDAD